LAARHTEKLQTFPLQKKYHTPEFLRTMPHIRPRSAFNSTLLRFRSQSIAELTSFFAERDFTQTHPPIITSSDCEGAGEVFSLETSEKGPATEDGDGSFFRSPKYLTVSSQLHLEALAQAVGKVWALSPTFRAERSETSRHLSEFYMLEAEVNFVEEMEGVMSLVEDMLQHMTRKLYNARVGEELLHGKRSGDQSNDTSKRTEELERRWQGMMSGPWPRITYSEAIAWLQLKEQKFERPAQWESGLQAEHEKFLASSVGNGRPVFVTNYPKGIKPFYMLDSPGDGPQQTVECFDLLVPEACEIAGGSMREHRLPQLLSAMQAHGLVPPNPSLEDDLGSLKWYVDLRRWGSVPHGGFGLGFDRLLGYLAGVPNVKDVVTFPRWVGRCEC
jgi:asparaginyl-tRNA synthetase